MQVVEFTNAYFIKLGAKGEWEANSISNGILRLGWGSIPLVDVLTGQWDQIRVELSKEHPNASGTVTTDLNALKTLALSTVDDVWITFHQSKMWWCRLEDTSMEEDGISKFRRVSGRWQSVDAKQQVLQAVNLPGALSRVQGFRGTMCRVLERETLRRVLNAVPSEEYQRLLLAQENVISLVANAIKSLHWKDFETLVDLVFAYAGWRRVSVPGEVMKFADLILEEPITRDRYLVQVKSSASKADFEKYAMQFGGMGFRRFYFVVHTPTKELENITKQWDGVELLAGPALAAKVVAAGLVGWLLEKVR
jgi:hypothetical protein